MQENQQDTKDNRDNKPLIRPSQVISINMKSFIIVPRCTRSRKVVTNERKWVTAVTYDEMVTKH